MTLDEVPWAVVSDFDGTISLDDATDTILKEFAKDDWQPIEQQWIDGEITARECLLRQTALVRTSRTAIDNLIDTIEIDRFFPSFAMFCADNKIPLVIVSDGLDYVIKRILDRHGLSHIPSFANHWSLHEDETSALTFPFAFEGCPAGSCKCERMRKVMGNTLPQRVLFVGDGHSDFCAASRMANVVAAKSALLHHLQSNQLPCVRYENFADVRRILEELLNRKANANTLLGDAVNACA